MVLSTLLLTSAPVGWRLGSHRLALRLARFGRSLAYWSGVRSALGAGQLHVAKG
jgi:hypothetical protein